MVQYITLTLEKREKDMFRAERKAAERVQKKKLSWEKFFIQVVLRGGR